jgi:hypothetical protein
MRTGPGGLAERTLAVGDIQAAVLGMVVEGTQPVAGSSGERMIVAARSPADSRRLGRRKTGHTD